MKKITLLSLLLFTTALNAQVYRNSKFYSVALNFGGQALHSHETLKSIKFYRPSYISVNGHYKFNHIFGISPSVNFLNNRIVNSTDVKYANFTIDGTVDLNQMGTYGFREQIYEFSVLAHLGVGLSTMWKDRAKRNDNAIKGNDDMLSFSIGVTPRIRIAKNMLVNFDMTYTVHQAQDQYFDFSDRKARGFGGGFMRYSFGITYEFIR